MIAARPAAKPFGEPMDRPVGNENASGYTGHIHDTGIGLTYMQARFYDPVIGRFLSKDPVGFTEGGVGYFNRYAYVANDPVNATDPTGEFRVGANVEGQAILRSGGKFVAEVSVDFGTGEISADITVGQRAGLKGKVSAGVFAEPSSKQGNALTSSIVVSADASAEIKSPFGTAEASAEASFGGQTSTNSGESGFVADTDISASANLGPVSVDSSGRGTVSVGAGLGASVGQDVNVSASFSIPDTVQAVKNLFDGKRDVPD